MIFFRERRVLIRLRKSPEQPIRGFFMGLRVELEGTPNPQSGMIVNLKVMDEAFDAFLNHSEIDTSRSAFARRAAQFFKKMFPGYFRRLLLICESSTLGFDGANFRYIYRLPCDFYQDLVYLRRNCIIESLRPLSRKNLDQLRSQPWESSEMFLQGLKKLKAPLISAQIELPELRGWQKWNLLKSSRVDE